MDAFPLPPFDLVKSVWPKFAPCHDVREWAKATFLDRESALYNEEHKHLKHASLLYLWASHFGKQNGLSVAGTAEMYQPKESRWKDSRACAQMRDWNEGREPDFIVTLCAPYCAECSPEGICALIEHEMYHCGQARDEYGFPRFSKAGLPKFAMRGHDVEEFVGVVRRYGAIGANVDAMADAANRPPQIARAKTDRAVCGCGARV